MVVGVDVALGSDPDPDTLGCSDRWAPVVAACTVVVSKLFRLRRLYLFAREDSSVFAFTIMSSTLSRRCKGACGVVENAEEDNCGEVALGVTLPDSVLFGPTR